MAHLDLLPFFCAARIGNGWLTTYFAANGKMFESVVHAALTLGALTEELRTAVASVRNLPDAAPTLSERDRCQPPRTKVRGL